MVMGPLIADRRLYLSSDKSRAVEEGDAAAAYLLACEGGEIPVEEVARLGLSARGDRVVLASEPEPEPEPAPEPEVEDKPAPVVQPESKGRGKRSR
jgi:hypothetical protein